VDVEDSVFKLGVLIKQCENNGFVMIALLAANLMVLIETDGFVKK
jgi:hypothetical protein